MFCNYCLYAKYYVIVIRAMTKTSFISTSYAKRIIMVLNYKGKG